MGTLRRVLNFLKKIHKITKPVYQPVNRLEEVFIKACEDPAKRPEFFRLLFHFELLCLGDIKTREDGSQNAKLEASTFEGEEVIYAFTSKAALEWYITQNKLPAQNFLGFSALTLFDMMRGKSGLFLNSGHACSKYFSIKETVEILKEFKLDDHEVTMKAGETYRIGQPSDPPLPFIKSLGSYQKNSSNLKEIYFGLLATQKGELRFICVLEFVEEVSRKDEERIFEDLFIISRETLGPNKVIDFSKLDESSFRNAIAEKNLISIRSYL